jgi:hypothetical protein
MSQENIAEPDQKQAASSLTAMSEAEELEKAKAELSNLRDQINQTKEEAAKADALIKCLGDRARTAAGDYFVEFDLMDAHGALKRAYAWVEASLASLDDPDRTDKPEHDDSPVTAALITLQMAAQRFRDPRVDVARMERKIAKLGKIFDTADQIVRNA